MEDITNINTLQWCRLVSALQFNLFRRTFLTITYFFNSTYNVANLIQQTSTLIVGKVMTYRTLNLLGGTCLWWGRWVYGHFKRIHKQITWNVHYHILTIYFTYGHKYKWPKIPINAFFHILDISSPLWPLCWFRIACIVHAQPQIKFWFFLF